MEISEPFLSDGFASLNIDLAQSIPIKILRDTTASLSLTLVNTLPFSEKTSFGTSVLIQGVECGFINIPLHKFYFSSDHILVSWLYVLDLLYLLKVFTCFKAMIWLVKRLW